MEQILYTSVASEDIDAGDVFSIVQTSAVRNAERELTGLLAFAHGRFFQAIEGPTEQIDRLMASLRRDPRHHSIKVLKRIRIANRQFSGWRMKRVAVPDIPNARRVFEEVVSKHNDALSILNEYEKYLQSIGRGGARSRPAAPAALPSSPKPCSRPSAVAPSP